MRYVKFFSLTYCPDKGSSSKWHYTDDNFTFGSNDMTIDGERLYVASNCIYSFNFKGEVLWKSVGYYHYELSVVNDYLIAYLEEGSPIITVFDKISGAPLYFKSRYSGEVDFKWVMRFSAASGNLVVASPVFSNQIICFEILK